MGAETEYSLAVLRDFREENWPSMDLAADMLVAQLPHVPSPPRVAELLPAYRRVFSRLPLAGRRGAAQNADRLINRMWSYPRAVRRESRTQAYDAWHVCDHSYAQLVHDLPAERTGVFCHDLDTFRCLFDPQAEPRPGWFRRMARRILDGLQRAALVFHSTLEVRRQILERGLVDASQLVHAPYGLSSDFKVEEESAGGVELPAAGPFVLHVGSSIPRKRIDVLLEVFARLRARRPELRLVQVGGDWTGEQRVLLERLALGDSVEQHPRKSHPELARLYRRAAVVLQPSEAEGFGLPVIEALACGAPVVASDLAVLREVGGSALVYAPAGDIDAWSAAVGLVLDSPDQAPSKGARMAQAARYSWANHARIIAEAYRRLVAQSASQPCAE